MKKILVAGIAALALAQPAAAADMPVKAPRAVAAVWSWTGFYIGGNAGYSWGRSDTNVGFFNTTTGLPIVPPAGSITNANFNLNGAIAGGQIGYNWQANSWVFGIEADLQWSGQRGSADFLCAATGTGGVCLPGLTFLPAGATGTTLSLNQRLEWFGTLRGRLGMLVTPTVLGYVTGGLAYGSLGSDGRLASFNANGAAVAVAFTNTQSKGGWTFGGGLEGHLGGNWTGKIEYLYIDLGTFNSTVSLAPAATIGANISSRITDNILRVGLNYKFGPEAVVARY